ncbi:MAG: hypothetical protein K5790_02320 [Nitrosopumilus sp.]|uniref:hypothetical protein n=1 Tax=Nitrosopumilus sp. TaxID=2024843 RepID=UPI00247EC214|nr:hypothetical protein [Nitrosopumilus sp.]MCV0392110.1 hypothetical protein [Nitrosopumilus sp.]
MSRMNGRTRKRVYFLLVKRDGEFCKRCGVSGVERQLVIDHNDNNNNHNHSENLQLLCRRCNYLKNPRPVDSVCESESHEFSELQINRTKEPQFKRLLAQEINSSKDNKIPENDIINSCAEILDLSPVTIKRYLDKVCSSAGIYMRLKIVSTVCITWKPELDSV